MQNANNSQAGTPATNQPAPGTEPQQSQGAPASAAPDKPSKAKRLSDLLSGKKPDAPPNEGTPPAAGAAQPGAEGGSSTKPKKFNDLAASLDMELDELYGLEIATAADGSPLTVQTLKDHHAKRSDFSVAQLRWEEERTSQQNELVRGNAELRELLASIPRDKLDPKILEAVRAKVTQSADRERARTLKVIPEWRNSTVMETELREMGDWLRNYGYEPGYLTTVYDHRALRMMRDAYQREKRIKAALEEVEREEVKPLGGSKPQGGKPPSKQPRSEGPPQRGRAGLENLLNRE